MASNETHKRSMPDSIPLPRSIMYNVANGNSKGGHSMDIERYIDRLDQDRRDSEQRIQHGIENLKKELREDRHAMEQRITEERRLSEERIHSNFIEAMSEMREARKEIRAINRWVMGVCLTTVVSIVAIVITVVVSS